MGRLRKKGKAGAAKAYMTRSAAVKKLQCSLADFRRLCILKGGVSAYFRASREIRRRLTRDHKAFAKKISRALGRGEWSTAKHLEEQKPSYKLDHIIKERYPTFVDAVRDIDDALCMIFLFSSLPANDRVSAALVANCSRLAAEWQLYIMHSRSLRKVFLSIKGIYYQADVMDQNVTWLVPYQFTQNIPSDVDVRVMLTFLELYQTLLGFVFFKLYTDVGLIYPPPLDASRDEAGAGIGAFSLQVADPKVVAPGPGSTTKKASSKEVRRAIKSIVAGNSGSGHDESMDVVDQTPEATEADEEFVPHPSTNDSGTTASLPTLQTLSSTPSPNSSSLFSAYTFFLSREVSRPVFEFLIRSFGGRVGWPPSSGSGSPFTESDESITHVIIDRPAVTRGNESCEGSEQKGKRKCVQPQWVADCINAGRVLLEDVYRQGATLPPHLSPFDAKPGAYDPTAPLTESAGEAESESEEAKGVAKETLPVHVDAESLHAAELAAEVAGVEYDEFQKGMKELETRRRGAAGKTGKRGEEEDMGKVLLSNKKRKLYERMKHSQRKQEAEHHVLKEKRKKIEKEKRQSPR
ncbi:Pescadillo N-terminus-domain-containing protein [Pisolithus sp. B1]|nr:Pescadillo N-terminus-domain-containing protein [Pisolithus sp. B1]